MALPPLPREEIVYTPDALNRNVHSLYLYLRRIQDQFNDSVATVVENNITVIINGLEETLVGSSTVLIVFDPVLHTFTFSVKSNSIGTAQLINNSVTTVKINDAAITTAKLTDTAVTYAKIQDITTNKLLGRNPSSSGIVEEISLGTGLALSGTTLNVTSVPSSNLTLIPVMTGFLPTPGGLPILYSDFGSISEFIYNDLGSIIMAEITVS